MPLVEIFISVAIYTFIAVIFYLISLKISPKPRKDDLYACGDLHPMEKMTFSDLLKAVWKTMKRGLKR